jgi:predicted AlkP superfamily pyrophosphatase or phosphodiesterase
MKERIQPSRDSIGRLEASFAATAMATAALAVLVLGALGVANCGPPPEEPSPPVSELLSPQPRLFIIITIDQLRADYFVRYRPLFQFGLKRLLDEGASFANANHDHNNTVTGVGHATISTGAYPRHSGIIANNWYDRGLGERVYCAADPSHYRSPANLQVTNIGDWLKAKSPESKVFTVSAKDRAAIMLGGHEADGAFWYGSGTGEMTTSSYYAPYHLDSSSDEAEGAPRSWVEEFNDRKLLDEVFGTAWKQIPVDLDLEDLDVGIVDEGVYQPTFPHIIGGLEIAPDSTFYASLYDDTPLLDPYLKLFVEALIENEEMGADDVLDYLGVSFSQLDLVGHRYGPNSPEVIDTLLRLDRLLGDLLDFVDEKVGLEHTVIALTSDHGIMDLPEYRQMKGREGSRAGVDDVVCFQQVHETLKEKFGDERWVIRDFYLDLDTIAASNFSRQEIEREIADQLEQCDAVNKVWTSTELASDGVTPTDTYHRRFLHGYSPERSPDIMVQFQPWVLDDLDHGSTHGSAYDHDTRVPMVFFASGLSAGEILDPAYTVDIAPTLAGLLGIDAPDELDGVDRSDLVMARRDSEGATPGAPR